MGKKIIMIIGIILLSITLFGCASKPISDDVKKNMDAERYNLNQKIFVDNSTVLEEEKLSKVEGSTLKGKHFQSDIDEYKIAINIVQKVYDNPNATQIDVDNATDDLNKAEIKFINSPHKE